MAPRARTAAPAEHRTADDLDTTHDPGPDVARSRLEAAAIDDAATEPLQGPTGHRISTRQLPDFAVRFSARFLDPSLRAITPALGRRNRHSTEKARRLLGWQPRPAAEVVVDCARSLIERKAV